MWVAKAPVGSLRCLPTYIAQLHKSVRWHGQTCVDVQACSSPQGQRKKARARLVLVALYMLGLAQVPWFDTARCVQIRTLHEGKRSASLLPELDATEPSSAPVAGASGMLRLLWSLLAHSGTSTVSATSGVGAATATLTALPSLSSGAADGVGGALNLEASPSWAAQRSRSLGGGPASTAARIFNLICSSCSCSALPKSCRAGECSVKSVVG